MPARWPCSQSSLDDGTLTLTWASSQPCHVSAAHRLWKAAQHGGAGQGPTSHLGGELTLAGKRNTRGQQRVLGSAPPEREVSRPWQATWAGSQPCQVSATPSDLQGGGTQTPPGRLGCGIGCGSGSFHGCGAGCETETCRAGATLPWCLSPCAALTWGRTGLPCRPSPAGAALPS